LFTVQASFGGDAAHSGSNSRPLIEVVNCTTCTGTATTMTPPIIAPLRTGEPINTLELRQRATITVMVAASSGVVAPSGSVQLYDNGVALGPAQVLTAIAATASSSATFDVNDLAAGAHTIMAVYPGLPTAFGGSLSASVGLRRSPRPR
ncbi:MAG TPA: Ig-like domain-containing protein, partial [Terriglobales bacterium]|nr:Ig-like domain-containing protein [Terriglobales bacterium]